MLVLPNKEEILIFDKIRARPKVSEVVMERLLQALSDGEITIGTEMPPERDLAERMGIGRGSLRECLAILEFMGIIESKGNRKVVVKGVEYLEKAISIVRISGEEDILIDFLEFRRVLEPAIVTFACDRATPEDIDKLQEIVDWQRDDITNVAADHAFHTMLGRAAHNAFMVIIEDYIVSMLTDIRVRGFAVKDRAPMIVREHEEILDSIRSRDHERAVEAVLRHIDKIAEVVNHKEGEEEESLPAF